MKKITSVLFLFVFAHYAYSQAQNIYFNFVDCSGAQFPITDIRSITFTGGNLNVNKKNWTTETWPLSYVGSYNFTGFNCTTGISDPRGEVYSSIEVYPNPAKGLFNIKYTCVDEKLVTLDLYDLTGQLLKHINNSINAPGTYEVLWDGKDEKGNNLLPGSYLISLSIGGKLISKNITITN